MTQYLAPSVEALPDGQVQLTISQYADFSASFLYQDVTYEDDGTTIATSTPRDLTGYSAVASCRSEFTSASSLFDFDVAIPSPTTGVIEVFLDRTITSTLTSASKNRLLVDYGYWDLHISTPAGIRKLLLHGKVRLNRSATH